ncbi:MAG: hypothetical protein KGM47_18570, partial [Acidobacteriota bacterium]|nr:hypothetical protein [Acidobacteriota bacterium]
MSVQFASANARRRWISGAGGFAAILLVFALASIASPASHEWRQAAHDPLEGVTNAMYNTEYGRALTMVRSWLKSHPDDVQGWNYLGEAELDQE